MDKVINIFVLVFWFICLLLVHACREEDKVILKGCLHSASEHSTTFSAIARQLEKTPDQVGYV